MTASSNSQGITALQVPALHSSDENRVFRSRVHRALENGDRAVILDCRASPNVDVRLLSTLLRCADLCRDHGTRFELVNVSSELQTVAHDLLFETRLGMR